MRRGTGLVAATLLIGGCNHLADQPALIADPGPASTAEISTVLSEALGRRDILIAPDALTRTSFLTLERTLEQRDRIAGGREIDLPERFDLVLSDGSCFLVHAATGRRYLLEGTACVPAPGAGAD